MTSCVLMSKALSYFVLMVMVRLYRSVCVCHLYMKMALCPYHKRCVMGVSV